MREEGAQLARLETGPLPERVKLAIAAMISTGGFSDGRLPREEVLARQLGVSRGTARAALRSLEEEGLITRQRGRGTYVNQHVADSGPSINRVVGFYDLIKEAGYDPGIAWTRLHHTKATKTVAERLALDVGASMLTVERLFTADGAPALHLSELVPRAHLSGIEPAADLVPNSIFEFADQFCIEPIDHTVVEIEPIVADRATAAFFDADSGLPLLSLLEIHYTIRAQPLLLSEIQTDHRYLRFTVVRRRT